MRCGAKQASEAPSLTRHELKQEIQDQLGDFRRKLLEDFSAQLQSVLSDSRTTPLQVSRALPQSGPRPTVRHYASDGEEELTEVTKKGFRKNIETEFQNAMDGIIKSQSRSRSSRSDEDSKRLSRPSGIRGLTSTRRDPSTYLQTDEERPFVASLSEPRQLCTLREEEVWFRGDSCSSKLRNLVESDGFGYFITSLVLVNAVLIGIETDFAARNGGTGRLPCSHFMSTMFCYIFTTEVIVRLYVHGLAEFFCGNDWRWNIFDFLVVGLQWFEQAVDLLFMAFGGHRNGTVMNFGFLRILRTLRVVRIMRLARVLHLVVELRTMVSSIVASLKPLFWATLLFSMLIYAVAVAMTQIANEYRSSSGSDSQLERYFANLGVATLALWECISGGMDWQDMAQPLIDDVSPMMAIVFSAYVAFSVLAMMNVITGIFVDNAKTYAQQDKDSYVVRHVLNLFKQSDLNEQNRIDWKVFQAKLDTRELQELFDAVDVNVADARSLFKLIDTDNSGSVSPDELMRGWIRLQGPAKALDLSLLLRESTRNFDSIHRHLNGMRQVMSWLARSMETLVLPDLNEPKLEHAPLDLLDDSRSFTLSPGSVRPPAHPAPPAHARRSMSSEGFKYQVLPQDENA